MLDDSPYSLSEGLLFTMEKTMKCCHYNGDQMALWQPDTWSPLWLWLPFVPVFHIWHIHTPWNKPWMSEQRWTWGLVFARSDMGNKQTIFSTQQLDAYQVGVSPVSVWMRRLASVTLTVLLLSILATSIWKQSYQTDLLFFFCLVTNSRVVCCTSSGSRTLSLCICL